MLFFFFLVPPYGEGHRTRPADASLWRRGTGHGLLTPAYGEGLLTPLSYGMAITNMNMFSIVFCGPTARWAAAAGHGILRHDPARALEICLSPKFQQLLLFPPPKERVLFSIPVGWVRRSKTLYTQPKWYQRHSAWSSGQGQVDLDEIFQSRPLDVPSAHFHKSRS